jgi:large subunit ribosomal protein L35|tara:strand:- start:136 stop:339 length:204 start_codon:yes stop_codon:yes gene_type:complete
MPKMKTHKGAQSRFHVTGTGKILRMKGGSSHLRIRKTKRVKRAYHDKLVLHPSDRARLKKVLPYGVK